jgi:hypothetical protein
MLLPPVTDTCLKMHVSKCDSVCRFTHLTASILDRREHLVILNLSFSIGVVTECIRIYCCHVVAKMSLYYLV